MIEIQTKYSKPTYYYNLNDSDFYLKSSIKNINTVYESSTI